MTLQESQDKLSHSSPAPDFSLKATDGKTYSLSDFKDKNAILIVFMCNHCPYVKAKLPDLNKIANTFKSSDLQVIGINSNESENYPEDSFQKMQTAVSQNEIQFLYLHDETQEVAKKYGAVCTPDPFLFDENQKLIFHSRIADPPSPSPSTNQELFEAIQEFLQKGSISQPEFSSMGCSIKWK